MRTLGLAFCVCVLLVACVPVSQDNRPSIAIINAPADIREAKLAEELSVLLRPSAEQQGYRFARANRLRFQETHRDMTGHRAYLQAAFIARSVGADYSVMIAAPEYHYEVRDLGRPFVNKRKVTAQVQLEFQIIDPETADPVARYASLVSQGFRVEPKDMPRLEPEDDPLVQEMRRRALEDVARVLEKDLAVLMVSEIQAVAQ